MSDKIMSGRELRERLMTTTEDSKRMNLLCELVCKQQEDIFFLNKQFAELAMYMDKITDTLVQLATGTSVLGAKVAPFLKEHSENQAKVAADNLRNAKNDL